MIYTRQEPLAVASGNGEVWPFTLYWEGLPPSLLGGGSSGRQPDTWPVSLHNGLVYKGFHQAGQSQLVAVDNSPLTRLRKFNFLLLIFCACFLTFHRK